MYIVTMTFKIWNEDIMNKMKFELKDVVSFEYKDKRYVGTILIKDFGGAYKYSNVHCYDVLIVEENLVVKHVREFELTLIAKNKD